MLPLATSCPHCGRPILPTPTAHNLPTVIEQTAKKWKGLQVIGGLMTCFGFFMAMAGEANSEESSIAPTVLALVGLLAFLYGRFGAWWYHA